MVMRCIPKALQIKEVNKKILSRQYLFYIKNEEEFIMLKLLAKLSEKYAKSTNTACIALWFMHQPKMPVSLIKKD